MNNQTFDYSECKNLILMGILDALEQNEDKIKAFPKHPIGTTKIHRMSLDIHPWHNSIMISFCEEDDDHNAVASWKYFDFISSDEENKYPSLKKAADFITNFYDPTFFMEDEDEFEEWEENEEAERIEGILISHIIFLAGAEALLDKKSVNFYKIAGLIRLLF